MCDAVQAGKAVEQYGDMVRRICFLHLKNQQDAEDVFQDVFLKYMLRSPIFESPNHEKAWLARVTINRCKDTFRRMAHRSTTSLEDADHSVFSTPPAHSEVLDAVLALPPTYKDVVYLHYYEGYSALEIAKIIGKSENAVYSRLSRARSLLRESLKEWDA